MLIIPGFEQVQHFPEHAESLLMLSALQVCIRSQPLMKAMLLLVIPTSLLAGCTNDSWVVCSKLIHRRPCMHSCS